MKTKLPWRLTKFAITFFALALLFSATGFLPLSTKLSIVSADKGSTQQGQKQSRAEIQRQKEAAVPQKPDNFASNSTALSELEQGLTGEDVAIEDPVVELARKNTKSSLSPVEEYPNSVTMSFSNNANISIPTSGIATPYPATVNVSGFTGNITKVTATLTNLSHTFVSDIDVILVSPTGQKVALISAVGGINPATNVNLTLDDDAAMSVSGTQVVSGTFKPTSLTTTLSLPAPAPPAPYATMMAQFNGQSPNGVWSLYVFDTVTLDGGSIAGGFSLTITDDGGGAPPPPPPVTTTATFMNTAPISIPSVGIATPYPATVNVSGLAGNTTKVTVGLNMFNHTFPDDVDVLLVSPTGQKVVIFSDLGGSTDAVNLNFTLDDAAAMALPDNGPLVSGTFRPTNSGLTDTFAAPAPPAPYGTMLSDFNGVSPNGTWSLYVVDDLTGDLGNFNGGFSLTITTAQVVVATVQFSATNYMINEDGGNALITVTRTGSTTGTAMVNYATSNGTATAGSDYTATSGTLTFPDGSAMQSFMVPVLNDNLTEPNETVNLTLSMPTGATLGTPSTAVLTITNDDRLDHTTVYAVDTNNSRIQRSTSNGMTWTAVGFGPGTALGSFNAPKGVSSSLNDMIVFVADTGNNRIQRSTNGGSTWQLLAGPGTAVGTVNAPQSIAYDERNNILYIADTGNNRIQRIMNASTTNPLPSLFANTIGGAAVGQVNAPRGIAVDGNGLVYVADTGNSRIQVNMTGMVGGWQVLAGATAGTAPGKFNQPRGIYANGAGEIYVADTLNNRIQKLSGGIWSVFMPAGNTLGAVNAPEGIVTTSTNFAFVGDTANNRVQRLTTMGTSSTLVGGPGVNLGQFNQVSGMR
ncbi:MAG: hypothetical protein JNM06_22630 [Blastocatellia bacterium]|nr:hypothetical protein [Blastocatellia bacterium]MBN8723380.1 hypothetical protein [Acidobacteriota bacterium]